MQTPRDSDIEPKLRSPAGGKVRLALPTRVVPYVLFLGCFAAYASTLTSAYTFDSVAYATQIRQFVLTGRLGWLFHPHHLLYNPLGYCAWRLLVRLGLDLDPLKSLQHLNALIGALGVVLVYEVIRRGGLYACRSRDASMVNGAMPALTAALIVATSHGYWTCATDGRVNVPALVGVMAVVGLAWGVADRPSCRQALALAAATVLAVLLHQSNGLLILAGTGAILMSTARRTQRLLLSLLYLSACVAGIAGAYLAAAAAIQRGHSVAALQSWMLAYAHDGRWWSFNILPNLRQDMHALVRVFVATESAWGARISIVVPAALLAALACAVLMSVRRRRRCETSANGLSRRLVVLAMVAGPYAAFFTVWNPGYFVFWLPVGLALVTWLAVSAMGMGRRGCNAWCAIGQLWVLIALPADLPTILHRTHRAHNPHLAVCDALKRHTRPGDMILITGTPAGSGTDTPYLEVYGPYFAGISVKSTLGECKYWRGNIPKTVRSLRGVVRNRMAGGHQVLVMGEFLNAGGWKELENRYPDAKGMQATILQGYRLEPVLDAGKQLAYRLVSTESGGLGVHEP